VNRGVDRSAAVAAAGMLLAVATPAVAAEFRRAVEQAESAYADGRLGEAVERYTHAITIDDTVPELFYNRGNAHHNLGLAYVRLAEQLENGAAD